MSRKSNEGSIKDSYHLSVSIRSKVGIWGDWTCKGEGEWIGLEQVQNQIKMLRMAFSTRGIRIKFERNGKLLDYNGNETDKAIEYEKTG